MGRKGREGEGARLRYLSVIFYRNNDETLYAQFSLGHPVGLLAHRAPALDLVFSVTFTFAICYRPSVCLSSVERSRALLMRLKYSSMLLRHLVPWPSVTFR